MRLQPAADFSHDPVGVAIALSAAPLAKLRSDVGRGLPGQRGIASSLSRAVGPMAIGAGRYAARGRARVVELHRALRTSGSAPPPCGRGNRHRRIVYGELLPGIPIERPGDLPHLLVAPQADIEQLHLAEEVPAIHPGQTGHIVAVPFSAEPVAGDAGVLRAGVSAAECEHFAGELERVARCGLGHASAQQAGNGQSDGPPPRPFRGSHPKGTFARPGRFPSGMRGLLSSPFPLWLVPLALAACAKPPTTQVPDADAETRGLAAIERVGCGACHEIPGVAWPRGRLGPSLEGFDDVGLIAGALPNEFELLAQFVQDAPSLKPGSAMPAMPLSAEESRDVAAYLYGIDDA